MSKDAPVDYYEVLQISASAEPDTVHRVYRLLAQRLHPDNRGTGDEPRFRQLTEAYQVISDPEQRARYDVAHQQLRQDRWRLVSKTYKLDSSLDTEHLVRTTVLEVLYARRRFEPYDPGIFVLDLEKLTGTPREHLEFTLWYLAQKKLVQKTENSNLIITADGVDYLESHLQETQPKRLVAKS